MKKNRCTICEAIGTYTIKADDGNKPQQYCERCFDGTILDILKNEDNHVKVKRKDKERKIFKVIGK